MAQELDEDGEPTGPELEVTPPTTCGAGWRPRP